MNIEAITYPARPTNGGPLDKAPPKSGDWIYEPKYNGWRALVHLPTGAMFNRHGQRLSIEKEFTVALELLCVTLDAEAFKWADCEALERRHNLGRGSLIVFDVIPEKPCRETPWIERRSWIERAFPILEQDKLAPNKVYLPSNFAEDKTDAIWWALQETNRQIGCDLYEGLVAKRADSKYPIQLVSPAREFPFWIKHRFAF